MPDSAFAVPAASSSLPASLAGLVWRGAGMAAVCTGTTPSGYPLLDERLPGGGWPHRGLIDLLLQQSGIGEMRLLLPALQRLSGQRIALLQPPHLPQVASWRDWGLSPDRLLWIRAPRMADALWSAEQVLRNGSCGALLLWQGAMRSEALRRLQMAAQASDMLCWLLRPLAMADAASPAPLRLALRPHPEGLHIELLKRRGPQCTEPLLLQWPRSSFPRHEPLPIHREFSDAFMDCRLPAAATAAGTAPELV